MVKAAKASGAVRSRVPSPSPAMANHIRLPACSPASAIRALRPPRQTDCAMMNIMFGPGVMLVSAVTRAKVASLPGSMSVSLGRSSGGVNGNPATLG